MLFWKKPNILFHMQKSWYVYFYDKNMSSLAAASVYMRFTEAFNVQGGKSLQISIWVTCWLSPSFLCSIRQEIPRIFVDLWQSDTPLWALEVSKLEGDLSETVLSVEWLGLNTNPGLSVPSHRPRHDKPVPEFESVKPLPVSAWCGPHRADQHH